VRVFIRKRPIFPRERKASEFDVVSCGADGRSCTVHDARMRADMRRRFLVHHEFRFDRVFDARATNADVFAEAADALVDAAIAGSFTTCMMYGQTGSGKTYTMSALYEQASVALFQRLQQQQQQHAVSVSFVEIAGDACRDLLNRFADAPLLTSKDGLVWPYPVVEISVASAADLIAFIKFGAGVRTTEATGVHDASSRSHAVLRIYVRKKSSSTSGARGMSRARRVAEATQRLGSRAHMSGSMAMNYDDVPVGPGGGAENFEGVLSLVDLAGSEKNIDSMYHSAQRRKEGAQINASLMALKSCIRARAAGKNRSHVYRKSKLTMALKGSFILPTARTVIIATVSPSSKDTEHSLNTLKHACIMDVTEGAKQSAAAGAAAGNLSQPGREQQQQQQQQRRVSTSGKRSWTQEIGEINVSKEARILKAKQANGLRGLQSNGNDGFQKDSNQAPLTAKEIRRQRISAERRALALLSQDQKDMLNAARTQMGHNAVDGAQQHRLQRCVSPYPQHAEQIAIQVSVSASSFFFLFIFIFISRGSPPPAAHPLVLLVGSQKSFSPHRKNVRSANARTKPRANSTTGSPTHSLRRRRPKKSRFGIPSPNDRPKAAVPTRRNK
jgi:kinesin family member 2/24